MEICDFSIDCNSYSDHIYILPIGDIHLGDVNCDYKYLKELLEWAYKTKNVYLVLMGDLGNYFSPSDKRYDHDTIDYKYPTPEHQFKHLKDLFMPFAKDKRILAVLEGNHEATSRNLGLFDFARNLAHDLKVNFGGYCCFINIHFNWANNNEKYKKVRKCRRSRVLTIFATHGSGNGSRPGAKVNRVEDLSRSIDADVYLHAHNHILSIIPSIRLGVAGSTLTERKVLYVNTGTLLKSWKEGSTSYAERKSMLPSKIGVAKIRVEPYRMDLHASL